TSVSTPTSSSGHGHGYGSPASTRASSALGQIPQSRSQSRAASVGRVDTSSSSSLRRAANGGGSGTASPIYMHNGGSGNGSGSGGASPLAHSQAFASAREAIRRGRERSGMGLGLGQGSPSTPSSEGHGYWGGGSSDGHGGAQQKEETREQKEQQLPKEGASGWVDTPTEGAFPGVSVPVPEIGAAPKGRERERAGEKEKEAASSIPASASMPAAPAASASPAITRPARSREREKEASSTATPIPAASTAIPRPSRSREREKEKEVSPSSAPASTAIPIPRPSRSRSRGPGEREQRQLEDRERAGDPDRGSAHAGAQILSGNVNGSADAPVTNVPTRLTDGRGSGSTEGHAGADEQPTRRARSSPPKSPSRARSVEKDKDRERSPSRARNTEGRNASRKDAPALPTTTPAPAPSTSSHASSTTPSGAVSRAQSSSTGSAHAKTTIMPVDNAASSTVGRSKSLPPSNSHIPLAMQNVPLAMQTRPREVSDPRAAQAQSLLATAATRVPGSQPQHVHAYAQPPVTSPTRYTSTSSSTRQRTPERTVVPAQRTTPERRPSQSESLRAVSEGAHLTREGSFRSASEGAHLTREGSFRTAELALDVKRLMAKPVSVSAHGASSGAEGTQLRRKRYDAAEKRVEPLEEERTLPPRRSEDGAASRRAEDRERERNAREAALAFDKEKKEKRPKNVLRRRPSANRPATAPAVASPALAAVTPAIARAGPPTLNLNLSLDPMSLSFTGADAPSPRGSPGEGSTGGSGSLTPAGAVVQAYKRGLGPNSPGTSPLPSPSSSSFTFKRKQTSDNGHGGLLVASAETASPPVTPYYTVFGSTSGRVVAVGGPDDTYDGGGSFISASAFPLLDGARPRHSKSKESSSGRTLTRKVSERLLRKRDEDEDVRGRTSSQVDHRKKSPRSGSRATGDDTQSPTREPESAMWGKSPAIHDGGFTNEPRSRRSEPALGGGSKIWKLMKRISTGGLKEKYDRGPRSLPPLPPLPPVPPVPQLPRDAALEARSAMSSDGHSRDEPGAVSRFMQSRTSLSGSQPTSGIPRSAPRSLPMPPPIPASRVSTTTRSSSPVSSSDVASSKYFHKTPGSGRSSTSSYGDDSTPPPMPGAPMPNFIIGKHIVPPKDLYKLDLSGFQSGSPDEKKVPVKPTVFFGTQNTRGPDEWTIINTPAEEHPPSLPHPPRRLPMPSHLQRRTHRLSDTPSIPEFSTVNPVNAFSARKPPVTDKPRVLSMLSTLEPAPPRRSLTMQDDTRGQLSSVGSVASNPSAPTARQKRLQQRSASLPRAEPLTFRGMSEKAAQALTEKEKADRWDDLLQRSDRAGGTLHLGTSEELPSDDISLRYSTSSAQLLNDF
ncbi:hypothetical protein DFH08DRAFT_865579, partial [Mycena albidolilacea]